MCGIAGILVRGGRSEAEPALRRMLDAVASRGPDDRGETYLQSGLFVLGLGCTRLAIQDPSPAGHQPMGDGEGRWIAYNGEIYNFHALREELSCAGPWASGSDTEVLLRALALWGRRALARLRGMFGFGFWDQGPRRLVLARDPLGIKPLYYHASPDTVLFASELRALLASGRVPRRLSRGALGSYLSFGSVEDPLTLVEGACSLPRGSVLVAQVRGAGIDVEVENPEPLAPPGPATAGVDAAESVRAALEDSVRAHLVSDVPLGAFLSGGIDSSAVVAFMSRVSRETPRTFTVVFPEREFSEAEPARIVARRFRTEHTEITLDEAELLAMLPEALAAMDQPTMDGVNTFVVARAMARCRLKVALSGLGGDELFGGYPSFSRLRRLRWLRAVPRSLRRGLTSALRLEGWPRTEKAAALLASDGSPRDVYLHSRRLFPPRLLASLLPACEPVAAHLPALPPGAESGTAISLLELGHYTVNTLLRDADAMTMAHSIELRVPFLDREVVGAVLAVPPARRLRGRGPKPLLLEALSDLLPERILRRSKQGFTLPLERWMQRGLRSEIESVLGDADRLAPLGLTPPAVHEVWRTFLRHPRRVGWSRPWALYVVARWAERHGVAP